MSENRPSQTESNGGNHDPKTGRFLAGNHAARGSAVPRKVARLRERLFSAVTQTDFLAVVEGLVTEAKSKKPWAVKLLLEYLLGPPTPADIIERIEFLESLAKEKCNAF